eukprot:scaffold47767_cov36-Tisochrysis_lutea.AAC.1
MKVRVAEPPAYLLPRPWRSLTLKTQGAKKLKEAKLVHPRQQCLRQRWACARTGVEHGCEEQLIGNLPEEATDSLGPGSRGYSNIQRHRLADTRRETPFDNKAPPAAEVVHEQIEGVSWTKVLEYGCLDHVHHFVGCVAPPGAQCRLIVVGRHDRDHVVHAGELGDDGVPQSVRVRKAAEHHEHWRTVRERPAERARTERGQRGGAAHRSPDAPCACR